MQVRNALIAAGIALAGVTTLAAAPSAADARPFYGYHHVYARPYARFGWVAPRPFYRDSWRYHHAYRRYW